MNTRKLIFIIVTGIAVLFIIALFVIFSFGKPSTITPQPVAPTSAVFNPTQGLALISTTPINQSTQVPVNSTITMTFNKTVEGSSPTIQIFPSAPFSFSVANTTLTITPTSTLSPSTNYTVSTTLEGKSFFVLFTTAGSTPTPGPNTRDVNRVQKDTNTTKEAQPDTFLSNLTPYSDGNFSVTSDFSQTLGQFQFTVVSTSGTTVPAQTAFTEWAKKQGLNDEQIARVGVVYK